jgi:hypothetical protein
LRPVRNNRLGDRKLKIPDVTLGGDFLGRAELLEAKQRE